METVFEIATEIMPHQLIRLLANFLSHNQSPDDFHALPLFRFDWTAMGSPVPVFENEIAFLQSMLPLLVDLSFMKHRVIIEEQIRDWRSQIAKELRKQFAQNEW